MANSFFRAARAAARRDLPLLAAGQLTARQAARVLAHQLIRDHRLNHVVYRSGAHVPVRAWAEAATLAKPAVACNSGTLNRAREDGIQYVEVFDGPDCGWTSHRDLDRPAAPCAPWTRRPRMADLSPATQEDVRALP